jgi:hypothetical protein
MHPNMTGKWCNLLRTINALIDRILRNAPKPTLLTSPSRLSDIISESNKSPLSDPPLSIIPCLSFLCYSLSLSRCFQVYTFCFVYILLFLQTSFFVHT